MASDIFYRSRFFLYSMMTAAGSAAAVSSLPAQACILIPLVLAVVATGVLHRRKVNLIPVILCLVFLYGGFAYGWVKALSWQGRGGAAGQVTVEGRIEVGCLGDQDDLIELLKVSRVLEGAGPRDGDVYLLRAGTRGSDFRWGDSLQVKGNLFLFEARSGTVAGSLLAGELKVLGHTRNPLLRLAVSYRERLREQVESGLKPDVAGLIEGMVLGDYRLLGAKDLRAFRLSGLIHLCAASGLNVAILAGFILWIGTRLRLSRRAIFVVQVPLLLAYALAVGLSVPIERATIVALVAVAGYFSGRDFDFIAAMGAAVFYLVWRDPGAATGVSFQLCFASALGTVLLFRPICRLLGSENSKVVMLLAATLAAQLAVAPLLLFHFGEVSLLAPAANLLAIPLVAPVMALAMLSSLLWLAGLPLAGPLMAAAAVPARLILATARLISAPGWAALHIFPFSPLWMLLFYPALAAGLLGGRKWRAPGRWILIGMIVAAVLAGVVLPIMPATASGGCLITCMDVGQGDATLIQAGGSAVLIDGGPDPDVLSRKLRSRRLCYLDAVVISHAESDHIGGLSAALDQCKVGMLIHPGTKTGGTMEKLLGQAEQLGVGTRIMRKGDSLSVGEIGLKALGPPQEIPEGAAANEYCLVIRADVNGVSLLLTGDIEEEGEDYLLREPGALTCDIIKVPHHGGFAEGCGEFFYAVKPRVALIGVGKDNRYGHPTRATLQALQRCGCAIYRTDLDGDIRVEALPGGLRVECERSRAA